MKGSKVMTKNVHRDTPIQNFHMSIFGHFLTDFHVFCSNMCLNDGIELESRNKPQNNSKSYSNRITRIIKNMESLDVQRSKDLSAFLRYRSVLR